MSCSDLTWHSCLSPAKLSRLKRRHCDAVSSGGKAGLSDAFWTLSVLLFEWQETRDSLKKRGSSRVKEIKGPTEVEMPWSPGIKAMLAKNTPLAHDCPFSIALPASAEEET